MCTVIYNCSNCNDYVLDKIPFCLKIKISNRLTYLCLTSQFSHRFRQNVAKRKKESCLSWKLQNSEKQVSWKHRRDFGHRRGRATILISSLRCRVTRNCSSSASVVAPKCISPRLRVYWPRRHPLVALPPLSSASASLLSSRRALRASFLRASPPGRRSPTTTTSPPPPPPLSLPTPLRHFLPPLLTLHPLNESYAAGNRHEATPLASIYSSLLSWLFGGRSLVFFIRFLMKFVLTKFVLIRSLHAKRSKFFFLSFFSGTFLEIFSALDKLFLYHLPASLCK